MKVVAKPIDVVVWTDKEGIITPVRFKVTKKDNEEKVVKINQVTSRDFERLAGNKMYIYNCTYLVNEVERPLQLKYEIETCKWMLFKI